MAAAVSARPASTTPSMTKPTPTPLHTSVNGASSSASASSPTLNNRPTPSSANHIPKGGTTGPTPLSLVNASLPRTRARPRLSHARSVGQGGVNGDGRPQTKEPLVKTSDFILRKFENKTPSLVLHLYPTHFRFDQQDGTFGYNSPMRIFLEHIKAQTVPHDLLEELMRGGVPFYDGCLIVEVHDHKSMTNAPDTNTANDVDGSKPFSIHNYNHFITPSPYQPYPRDADSTSSRPGSSKENAKEDAEKHTSGQGNTKAKSNKPRVFTTVLHPTPQSLYREMSIISSLPAPDTRQNKRQQGLANKDGLPAVPSTPISAVPNTPSITARQGAKRARMMLEEADVQAFEADVLLHTNRNLYLEPAEDFETSQRILQMLKDPLHDQAPVRSKARKRTHAELAADEAQAAEEERIALIMDERLEPSLPANNIGNGSDGRTKTEFQPNFARFKMLEDIKRTNEEHKKNEMLAAAAKRESEELEKKRRQQEMQATNARREVENAAQLSQQQQQQQQHLKRQMQLQMQMQSQRANAAQHAQPNGQVHQNMNMMQASHAPQASPVSASTPMQSSPLAGNVMFNPTSSQQAAPGVATAVSNAGSPPRPGSANMPAPQPMARGMSKQSQLSRTSTPQMPNSTPQLPAATPNMQHRNTTPQQANRQMQQNNIANNQAYLAQLAPEQRTNVLQQYQSKMQQMNRQQQQMSQMLSPQQRNMPMNPNVQAAAMARAQQGTPNLSQQGFNGGHMMQGQMSQQNAVPSPRPQMGPGQQQPSQGGQGMMGQINGNALTAQQQQFLLRQRQQQMLQQQGRLQQNNPQQVRGNVQEIRSQYMNALASSHNGQLPPNANEMFLNWWKTKQQQQQGQQQRNLAGMGGQAQTNGMGMNQNGMNTNGNNANNSNQGMGGMNNNNMGNMVVPASNQQGQNLMQPGQGMQASMAQYNQSLRNQQHLHQQRILQQAQSMRQQQQQQQQSQQSGMMGQMGQNNNMGMMGGPMNGQMNQGNNLGMNMNFMGNMGGMNMNGMQGGNFGNNG